MVNKKPTASKVIKREDHNRAMNESETYPAWGHDFISIHQRGKEYRLLSPMCIIEKQPDHARPDFEHETFGSKGDAISRAKGIARENGCFVVDCTG